MSKENSGLDVWAKKGYIMVDGKLTKSESLVNKGKVEKLLPLHVASMPDEEIRRRMADGTLPKHSHLPMKLSDLEPSVTNKKVRNATKTVVNGIKFDSKLEKYLYDLLKASKIDFEFQKVYVLQEKFRYRSEAVRAIRLTVDFFISSKNMIIDTKGYANDVAPLKYKMLKWHLLEKNYKYQSNPDYVPKIELPSTKAECDVLLNRILYEK